MQLACAGWAGRRPPAAPSGRRRRLRAAARSAGAGGCSRPAPRRTPRAADRRNCKRRLACVSPCGPAGHTRTSSKRCGRLLALCEAAAREADQPAAAAHQRQGLRLCLVGGARRPPRGARRRRRRLRRRRRARVDPLQQGVAPAPRRGFLASILPHLSRSCGCEPPPHCERWLHACDAKPDAAADFTTEGLHLLHRAGLTPPKL